MAQLATYKATAAGDKHKFLIDRNASRLLIKRTGPLSIKNGLDAAVTERLLGTIRDNNNHVEDLLRLDVRLSHVAAYSSMINKEPLFEIVATPANAGDLAAEDIDASAVDNSDTYITYLLVNLTAVDAQGRICAVGVDSEDTFELLIENMVGGATYTVYAVEEPVSGQTLLQYISTNKIQGQKLTRVNVDALDAIVVPAIEAITKVRMQFPAGEPVEYDIEQLKLINAQAHSDEYRQYDSGNNLIGSGSPLLSNVVVVMTHQVLWVELTSDGTQFEFTEIRNRMRGGE